MICRFDGCQKCVWNELNSCCQAHYTLLYRGKLPGFIGTHKTPEERFERMVNRSGGKDWLDDGKSELSEDSSECWKWTGKLKEDGYAIIAAKGKQVGAHRFAYEKWVGPITGGLYIDHLCRVRHCVNPEHLEAVTNEENIRRGGNAAKVICKYGHPLSGENLILTNQGTRQCRICVRRRAMEYYFRKTGRV
jgi:hypothetical protein